MSNYLYFQHSEMSLLQRYDAEQVPGEGYVINGREVWRSLLARLLAFLYPSETEVNPDRTAIRRQTIHELIELTDNRGSSNFNRDGRDLYDRSTEELIATVLLLRLRNSYVPLPGNSCPRLFISHRCVDKGIALRIAALAQENNFAFWLDILDPDLRSLNGSAFPEKLIPLMTACIIEMALINCTHLLACMTENSRGSLWIPYEYGRVRELPGFTVNTCAWLHPDLPSGDVAEYMLLGEIAQTEVQIRNWLRTEMKCIGKGYCAPVRADVSAMGAVDRLPEENTAELERKRKEYMQWLDDGMPLQKPLAVPKKAIFKSRKIE